MHQFSQALIRHRGFGNPSGVSCILPKAHIAHKVGLGKAVSPPLARQVKVHW